MKIESSNPEPIKEHFILSSNKSGNVRQLSSSGNFFKKAFSQLKSIPLVVSNPTKVTISFKQEIKDFKDHFLTFLKQNLKTDQFFILKSFFNEILESSSLGDITTYSDLLTTLKQLFKSENFRLNFINFINSLNLCIYDSSNKAALASSILSSIQKLTQIIYEESSDSIVNQKLLNFLDVLQKRVFAENELMKFASKENEK